MLPLKGAAAFACTPLCTELKAFDPNSVEHDLFWALGPINFYNASVILSAARIYELNAEVTASSLLEFGFRLKGDRPVLYVDIRSTPFV